MVMAAAKWNQLRGRVVKRMKKSYLQSSSDVQLHIVDTHLCVGFDAQLRIRERITTVV
jgi:hypothetical protein